MAIESLLQALGQSLQVCLVDLLLSGDNAIVIALACRHLPPAQRRTAMSIGVALAVVFRVLLTTVAGVVLSLPLLKLAGALALVAIAVKLLLEGRADDEREIPPVADGVGSAVRIVVAADLVMSIDNVVALSAVSQGNALMLVFGVVLSVPLLMLGSTLVLALMQRHRWMVPAGAAFLGWIAGGLAVTDPLYDMTLQQQSPALAVVVPWLTGAYVLLQARLMHRVRADALLLHPRRERPASAPDEPLPVMSTANAAAEAVPAVPLDSSSSSAVSVGAPGDAPEHPSRQVPPRGFGWQRMWGPGIGLAVVGALLFIGFEARLPTPSEHLTRYDCPGSEVSFYYTHAALHFKIVSGNLDLRAIVQADNQLDWGDLVAVSRKLGFVPPLKILYSDPRVLRVDGGMFASRACYAPSAD
jgi:YjbE family integral membrane protein